MELAAYRGPGTVYVEDPADFAAIFDFDLTYQKASWIVHMLRGVMGDAAFFAALVDYRAAHAHGTATTADLRAACEAASGRDLGPFFQQWLHAEYYPQYRYAWATRPVGDQTRVSLRIRQVQTNTGLFVMPLDVRVTTDGGGVDFRVENALVVETYELDVSGTVLDVTLDPDGWVLCDVEQGALDLAPSSLAAGRLEQNRPNPFNPSTVIVYELPAAGAVALRIYDAAGRLVRTLVDGPMAAGPHRAVWDGRDGSGSMAAAGVYLCRLEAPGWRESRKMTLLK
jgi:hypothetical protein